MAQTPTIDRLLNQVPDAPSVVLAQLQSHPELASKQDAHGYSLVHAAVSYEHVDLLKALIQEFHVDPNIKDEDGETALFNVESIDMAKELLQLGVTLDLQNDEGQTAAERLDDEDEQPLVAAYLRELDGQPDVGAAAPAAAQATTANASTETGAEAVDANGVHPPPPLPNGVQISIGTMQADEAGGEPDPEFRRRIEELAARSDFQTEDGQRELRNLVSDAVSGLVQESPGPASSRRRVE